MTPQEKAKELVEQFKLIGISYFEAKKCAIVSIEIHIKELYDIEFKYDVVLTFEQYYFLRVKAEIEKL